MAKEKEKQSHAELLADIRRATPDQLQDELLKLKKEQFNLRFQSATGQLDKTARVMAVRRGIARIKTVMREKAQAALTQGRGAEDQA